MADVQAWGITEEDLLTPEGRGFYRYLLDYITQPATRGSLPGIYQIQAHYPDFRLVDDAGMATSALCHELRSHRIRVSVDKALREADKERDGDPEEAIERLSAKLADLRSLSKRTGITTLTSYIPRGLERYEMLEAGLAVNPIMWPWPLLNRLSRGIEPTDYVIYYGRPKNKKSFVVLHHAMDIFLEQGKHVLFYSKEMPEEQIMWRLMAFLANVDYESFSSGTLDATSKARLHEMANMALARAQQSNGKNQISCVSGRDAPRGSDTVGWLRQQIKRLQPDVVFIDGLYLMTAHIKAKDTREKVESISREVRAVSLDLKIPVIATIQANRGADKSGLEADLDEIGFSDAPGQDATVAIRIVASKTDSTVNLLFPGVREWRATGLKINAVPCVDFSEIALLDPDAIRRSIAEDVPDEEPAVTAPLGGAPAPLGPPSGRKPRKKAKVYSRLDDIDGGGGADG